MVSEDFITVESVIEYSYDDNNVYSYMKILSALYFLSVGESMFDVFIIAHYHNTIGAEAWLSCACY